MFYPLNYETPLPFIHGAKRLPMSAERTCSTMPSAAISYAKRLPMSAERTCSTMPSAAISYAKVQ
ncbi:hypothetical protein [Segatella salivae]|uniref:hypothetical protein n=1 Tax=Segatella salivae TaxID=228604 RepID=UPI001CAE835A|nr:hypothetical protein [Segatella salivae]MBF1556880.1 hypothetical protein [Segatella salivae]